MSHHDEWRRERRRAADRKRLVMPAVTLMRTVAVAWCDTPRHRPLPGWHYDRRRRALHPGASA